MNMDLFVYASEDGAVVLRYLAAVESVNWPEYLAVEVWTSAVLVSLAEDAGGCGPSDAQFDSAPAYTSTGTQKHLVATIFVVYVDSASGAPAAGSVLPYPSKGPQSLLASPLHLAPVSKLTVNTGRKICCHIFPFTLA